MIIGATGSPAKEPTVVWGVDPSTNTGLVIMDGAGKLIHSCNLVVDPRYKVTAQQKAEGKKLGTIRNPVERASEIGAMLMSLADKYGYPAVAILEDYGFTKVQSVDSIVTQCYVGFVIRRLFWNNRVPVIEIPPTTLKKFIGANKKDEVMMKVFKRWGFEARTNDQADAYALARAGLQLIGDVPMTKEDKVTFAKMKNDEVLCEYVPPALLVGLH